MLKILTIVLCVGLLLSPVVWAEGEETNGGEPAEREAVSGHSVVKASILGIIPGAGQVYNRQYTKALIVAGAAGTVVALAIMYRNRSESRRDEYNLETRPDVIISLVQDFDAERERNKICWQALTGVVALSVLDSYIYGWKKNQALQVSLGAKNMEVGYAITF
jgi:hypothetical protein